MPIDTSHLLVSAATTLLRCTVEAGDFATKESAIAKLELLRRRLTVYQDNFSWDLSEFCLERCGDAISKMSRTVRQSMHSGRGTISSSMLESNIDVTVAGMSDTQAVGFNETSPTSNPDFFLPVDSLDYPWETLWDSFEGPWPIST